MPTVERVHLKIINFIRTKTMNIETLRSITFAPIYLFGFVFGVFPYKYDNAALYPHGSVNDEAFSRSTPGIILCYVFLSMHIYCAAISIYDTYLVAKNHDSCFEKICNMNICRNVCAHLAILWMNVVANFTSTGTVLVTRAESTVKCINDANRLLKMNDRRSFSTSYWMVVFFIAVQIISFVFHWKSVAFDTAFVYTYMSFHVVQCLPIVTECMISVLLLILENCYRSINDRIKQYRTNDTQSLVHLRRCHWAVTDFAEFISDTFSLDFLIVGVSSTVRFVYFLFVIFEYTAKQKVIGDGGGFVLPKYESVIFFVSMVGKFIYLCIRCDGAVSEAKKVIYNLYALENKCRTELEKETELQVNQFLQQVKCREVCFKAYDFFTLNLRLVFGITITYFIVLMQFQASHAA